MLPKGMATFLPEAAFEKRRIEEVVMAVFASWGYREVIPPSFEYLDVIALGMGEELVDKGYKFVDRNNGRMMLLRPDITPQIARMAAMLMSNIPKPLRLCYQGNVFRHEEEHAGRARELFQMGGELIGTEGPEGDAEVISIAIRSMEALGLRDFKVSLGQVGFFNGLISEMEFPADLQKRIHDAVTRRDQACLDELMEDRSVPKHPIRKISRILSLFGQEEVFEKAARVSNSPRCRAALARLKEVYRILTAEGWGRKILIDLAEVRGSDYYTGVLFEVFSGEVGVPLGRGGRYDTLVGKFGEASPATGFAFNVDRLQEALEKSGKGEGKTFGDVLLLGTQKDLLRIFKAGALLRSRGFSVIQQANGLAIPEAIKRAKTDGIKNILVLSGTNKAILINSRNGRRREGSIRTLIPTLKPAGK